MGAAEALTAAALAGVAALAGRAAWVDLRQRRIPNAVVLGLAALWLAWRGALGAAAGAAALPAEGLVGAAAAFGAAFAQAAPFGLPTAFEGLLAAVVLGGGMLAFALACEALTKREALGGGDVKLMAALALFLGPGRSAVCLLVACVAALVGAAGAALCRRSAAGEPTPGGVAPAPAGTFPFAPALAIGAAVALLTPAGGLLFGP